MLPLQLEGSIILAATPITGTAALVQLARLLRKWLKIGHIRNEEANKILFLSRSRGTKAGLSVISDIELAHTRNSSKVRHSLINRFIFADIVY